MLQKYWGGVDENLSINLIWPYRQFIENQPFNICHQLLTLFHKGKLFQPPFNIFKFMWNFDMRIVNKSGEAYLPCTHFLGMLWYYTTSLQYKSFTINFEHFWLLIWMLHTCLRLHYLGQCRLKIKVIQNVYVRGW